MKSLIVGAALLFAQSEVQTTLIRSIKYENFKGVSLDDMAHRLKDRGVRVAVEQFYEPQQVESARKVLQEFLEEKGRRNLEVKTEVKRVPPASVEVTFRAVKN
jgi:outer membrane protein insertion porin family